MKLKIDLLVVPITFVVAGIITIILAATGQKWDYYLIGTLVALMNHGLLVKQTARLTRMAKLDPEHKLYSPKKTVALWYFLRVLVFVSVFAVLVYKSNFRENSSAIWYIVTALGGYMTYKVIFIILALTFREKVIKE